mgnify:CR=1 FL=1
MKEHVLILMEFDDHHGVYGVYDDIQDFFKDFKRESPSNQAELVCCYDKVDIQGHLTIDVTPLKDVVPEELIKTEAMDIIRDYEAS